MCKGRFSYTVARIIKCPNFEEVCYQLCTFHIWCLSIHSHNKMAGYYGFTLVVCLSISLSYVCPSVVSFPDGNLSECQWIFTKLGMCIDIVEIRFWIANGQISSIFDSYLPAIHPFFFLDDNLSKYQCIFTKLSMCINIVEIWYRIANEYIS